MKVLQAVQGVGIDSEDILLKCTERFPFLIETHFTEEAPKLFFLFAAVTFKPGTAE